MDAGLWTLKCQRCGKTFEIELAAADGVLRRASEMPAPIATAGPGCPMKKSRTGPCDGISR